MPNMKTVNIGSSSLVHTDNISMNGLNDYEIGEGAMTSTYVIVIGFNSLNVLHPSISLDLQS